MKTITLDEAAEKFVRECAVEAQNYAGARDIEAVREGTSILILAELPGDRYVSALFDDASMPTATAYEIFANLAQLAGAGCPTPEVISKWRQSLAPRSEAVH